jgi:hypothetical protein
MYENMMNTLRQFIGSGVLRSCLIIAISFSVAVLAANMSPAYRAFLRTCKERGGWRNILITLGTGLFKFLLVFVLLRLFMTFLAFQANVFSLQHGRITGDNRSAVLMKWGYPHEQKELAVCHTRKRTWVTRQLKLPDEEKKKGRIFSESFWKDESYPVRAVDGKMPTVLTVKEVVKDVQVSQKSIVSADVDIAVRNNPRSLGNANYAGYNDSWSMKYKVINRSDWETKAHMSFPLPCKSGLFDEMSVTVDGESALDVAKTENSSLKWIVNMEPGQEVDIAISYKSRGLEHLRYIPKRMSQTGHYRVSMAVHGIPADKIDYPIGSMPAAEKLSEIHGDPYTLTWKLDNALTSYDIGIKLPVAEQPNYHFAALLGDAPVGLVVLVVLLTIPRLFLGTPVRADVAALLGAAYCLHFTFMGRLADVMSGFEGQFMISAALIVGVVGWFCLSGNGLRIVRIQDATAFALVSALYPLIVIDGDRTDLWMQCLYVGMLIYACS